MSDEILLDIADDAARAVVVTGKGKSFCAGAQLQGDGDTFFLARPSAGSQAKVEVGILLLSR